jgi:Flp pilus assembly protein TadG
MQTVRQERGQGGASMVEFALILPILLLIIGGIIDFGFLFNGQLSLTHGAREGARVAALQTGDAKAAAEDAVTAATLSGVNATVIECTGAGGQAQVVVSGTAPVFFAGFLPFVSDEVGLTGQAVMRCGG